MDGQSDPGPLPVPGEAMDGALDACHVVAEQARGNTIHGSVVGRMACLSEKGCTFDTPGTRAALCERYPSDRPISIGRRRSGLQATSQTKRTSSASIILTVFAGPGQRNKH